MDFIQVAFSCPIFQAYGATEACGCLTSTSAWDRRAGVVGGPLPCLKMKLRDRPELGYFSTDSPNPRGELLVKGNSVFKGYFRNPILTAKVLEEDGWLRTEDVAMVLPGGCLILIDRLSSFCKL